MKCPFKRNVELKRNKKESVVFEFISFGICDESECPYYKKDSTGKETCRTAETELKRFGK